ncbi:MAG TPA: TetR family transcriptional regulator C-terminal domain-containing protein [Deltaproteobacteria bacterium]|mgnify:CR=1 FL=1|nr:TetR family transcriptional regulator C-terminal domain-containing protein [Deltaproteobacteria bacterium]HPJ94680.1 TetR family transcriptional regulator C-terminal domain-containing protein [Deltaproteobacteria bacterium]HPR52079.1 TetR family transcriptional regulator C-terminal domain-containing protein [Deltaproteobacteria bacterium]
MNLTKGEKTRARILRSAMMLINTRGYTNTSINDIIESSGVQKGNLYFHFSSKDDLCLALIEEAKKEFLAYLKGAMKSDDPLGKINDILDAILLRHRKMNFIGGCIFGNMALEMTDINSRFPTVIKEVFHEWEELLAILLQEAQGCGDLDDELDPDSLAGFIVASIEGAIMMAKVSKEEDDLVNCMDMIRRMLRL